MLIKTADSRDGDISILEALLKHPDATAQTRKSIETEIKKIRSGVAGEKESAYEIDFHFKDNPNVAVIHDFRIEHEGKVAQIDHLLINRLLEVNVCETKRFTGGIKFNDQGECTGFTRFGSTFLATDIGSPIEQNKKHILVLDPFLRSSRVSLPTRLGLPINPRFSSYILISKNMRITRPKDPSVVPGIETVMKVDQFHTYRTKNANDSLTQLARIVSLETLEKFARQVARRHTPIVFNWAAKFGLLPIEGLTPAQPTRSVFPSTPWHEASNPLAAPVTPANNLFSERAVGDVVPRVKKEPSAQSDQAEASTAPKTTKSKLICACCGDPVPMNVARFCWFNKPRFKEQIVCQPCQPQFQ